MRAFRQIQQRLPLLVALLAALASAPGEARSANAPFDEESADVFLAKATLQQYLSREVRKDWDGVRRLTHPKARSKTAAQVAPWTGDAELKTFAFRGARQVAAGIVAIGVDEELARAGQHESADDARAVYLLVKARGGFRVAERRAGVELAEVREQPVVASYRTWVDPEAHPQARRAEPTRKRTHR